MPETQAIIQAVSAFFGIPAVSNGIGKLFSTLADHLGVSTKLIERKAAAEANAKLIEVISDERTRLVKSELKGIASGNPDLAITVAIQQADRRLQNIKAIGIGAASFMVDTVSETPVDYDWMTQFLVHCQDVGNAEMQSIWSQLLAGEVAKPGSFSLRTLATVKLLSREDAHLFTKLCKLVWTEDGGDSVSRHVLLPFATTNTLPSQAGLTFANVAHLEYVGLIRLVHQGYYHLVINPSITLQYGTGSFRVERDASYFKREARPVLQNHNHATVFSTGPIELTDIGTQLAPIAGAEACTEHLEWVTTQYRRDGWAIVPI
jgi:hypothetical protein